MTRSGASCGQKSASMSRGKSIRSVSRDPARRFVNRSNSSSSSADKGRGCCDRPRITVTRIPCSAASRFANSEWAKRKQDGSTTSATCRIAFPAIAMLRPEELSLVGFVSDLRKSSAAVRESTGMGRCQYALSEGIRPRDRSLDQCSISTDHRVERISAGELRGARRQVQPEVLVPDNPLNPFDEGFRVVHVHEQRAWLSVNREDFAQYVQIIGDDGNAGLCGLDRRKPERLGQRWKDENVKRAQEVADTICRQFSDKM